MNDSFQTLTAFTHPHEARVVLGHLTDAGVAAFLSGEMTAETFPGAAGLGPQVRLLVAAADLKRARDILACLRQWEAMPPGWEEDFPAEEGFWICPHCDEAVEEREPECPYCGCRRDGSG